MNVTTFTALTEKANIRVNQPASKLLLTCNAAFGTELISYKILKDGTDDKQGAIQFKVIRLGEQAAMDEGFIKGFKAGGKEHMIINLTPGGALDLTAGKKELQVDLSSLTGANTYEVNVIGHADFTDQMLINKKTTIKSGDNTLNLGLEGIVNMWVDNITAFTKVTLNFAGDAKKGIKGHSDSYTREDLIAMNNAMNDVVKSTQTITDSAGVSGDAMALGFLNMYRIPFAHRATSAIIETTGATDLDIYTQTVETLS